MKFIKWILITVLIVIIGCISFAFLYLQSSRPVYHGEVLTSGLNTDVKIFFDHYGIPHIYANSEEDAYYAMGYAHAQERLFQMEMIRRVGAGRLSEIFGSDLVKIDAFFRTLGINKSAKESAALFFTKPDEQWQKDALAYLEGINTFIFQGATPPEFLMLGIPKVKFTPEDIYLITGYMSFSFAEALRTDPILDKIAKKYGLNYLDAMNFTAMKDSSESSAAVLTKSLSDNSNISNFVDDIFPQLPVAAWLGSNGWLVGPSHSTSGKVLLANDTHIGYQQPAVWYEAHIEYPGFSLYGNYLAGLPFPLVGHNRNVSWGLTMFENDDMNLYREQVNPVNPSLYKYKNNWEEFQTRSETIKVKNKPDTTITIRETIHGPIINDVTDQLDESEKNPVSLWWTYTRFPATALQVTYNLTRARDVNDGRKAASMVHAPGLNILFGDTQGNIAWWAAAKLPIYRAGMNTKLILDGTTGDDDIEGYYEFEHNPQSENPADGIIYSANGSPDTVMGLPYPGYYAPQDRSMRIKSLLYAQDKWTLNDLKKVSTDAVSLTQPVNAKIIIEALKGDPVLNSTAVHAKAANLLMNWNGNHLLSDTTPTIYYKLLAHIFESAMMDELGEKSYSTFVNTHYMKNAYTNFLSNENSPWWDNIETKDKKETRKDIFRDAFSNTITELQKSSGDITNWNWGGVHTLEHIHPIGRKEPFNKIFNVGPFPVKGGIETINNAGFPLNTSGKYPVSYGPAMRLLIDMNDVENGVSVLPTGQSGHLRSPHYDDQNILHNSGKFRPMMMNKAVIQKTCTTILTLKSER
ncbi:MAG TPA: penicillin acylase family protein [Bacteroidia bacterium]|nr:penicillin acylase family protein [Bacteroidia bacterium]